MGANNFFSVLGKAGVILVLSVSAVSVFGQDVVKQDSIPVKPLAIMTEIPPPPQTIEQNGLIYRLQT